MNNNEILEISLNKIKLSYACPFKGLSCLYQESRNSTEATDSIIQRNELATELFCVGGLLCIRAREQQRINICRYTTYNDIYENVLRFT